MISYKLKSLNFDKKPLLLSLSMMPTATEQHIQQKKTEPITRSKSEKRSTPRSITETNGSQLIRVYVKKFDDRPTSTDTLNFGLSTSNIIEFSEENNGEKTDYVDSRN